MDLFDFFDMASEIMGFFKAAGEDIGNLFNPKKKRPFIHKPDDKPTKWGADSYEPWDFLSEEQWKEILRGDKPLDNYTTSHVWPPDKEEIEALAMKQEVEAESMEQENTQEQGEDSKNTEVVENSESPDELGDVNSASNSDSEFETDAFEGNFDSDYSSGDYGSGNYEGYIG